MKTWAYFNLNINETIEGYALADEDDLWIEYKLKKTGRRLLCEIKKNYREESIRKFNEKQLELW